MKVAIIHEMLIKIGWAEKVVESLLKLYPEADLYTLIYDRKKIWTLFWNKKIHISPITQRVYNIFKNQRFCLPFMSRAIESFDFSQYDLVIASSSAFAHWAITKPETLFVVYCHAPARYLWDYTNEYKIQIWFHKGLKSFLLNSLFKTLRIWDYIASTRSDITIANSQNTQARIAKYHKKDSIVLYPPIEVCRFEKQLGNNYSCSAFLENKYQKNNYYLIVSALTEFKKLDVAIDAFNQMKDIQLCIVWTWSYQKNLEWRVSWDNIAFVWPQYGDDLVYLVQNSLGLIFPGEEDFWMVPVEVLAAWKPVFALSKWGLLETVEPGVTWDFFDKIDGADFVSKFQAFHFDNLSGKYVDEVCRKSAERFSETSFHTQLQSIITWYKNSWK